MLFRSRRHVAINGVYLRDIGFWNLLSDVLSHLAVLRIRDWGSYYHLLSENPNAAEHLIMWLRGIKSTNALRGRLRRDVPGSRRHSGRSASARSC
mgnify:CR=1 FL=1